MFTAAFFKIVTIRNNLGTHLQNIHLTEYYIVNLIIKAKLILYIDIYTDIYTCMYVCACMCVCVRGWYLYNKPLHFPTLPIMETRSSPYFPRQQMLHLHRIFFILKKNTAVCTNYVLWTPLVRKLLGIARIPKMSSFPYVDRPSNWAPQDYTEQRHQRQRTTTPWSWLYCVPNDKTGVTVLHKPCN